MTRLAAETLRDVGRLHALGTVDDLLHRPDQLDAVKYRFITSIEGCVAIAHHVMASEGWAAPDTNAAAFSGLAEHDIVDDTVAGSMAAASGFWNLLVHQYDGTVEDAAVVGFLERLPDLEDYVRQVLTWMARESPPS